MTRHPNPNQDAQRWQTRISEAFWCDPTAGYEFKEATLSIAPHRGHVSWLDELFDGGIRVPTFRSEQRASALHFDYWSARMRKEHARAGIGLSMGKECETYYRVCTDRGFRALDSSEC